MYSFLNEVWPGTYQGTYGQNTHVPIDIPSLFLIGRRSPKYILKISDLDDVKGDSSQVCLHSLERNVLTPMNNNQIKQVELTKVWYTVIETAKILSISRTSVYHFVATGELGSIKPFGGSRGMRIPATAIVQFAQQFYKNSQLDSLSVVIYDAKR